MNNSALDDLIIVINWLASSKTPTGQVAEALERLKVRAAARNNKTGVENGQESQT